MGLCGVDTALSIGPIDVESCMSDYEDDYMRVVEE
jgi:hypothetical protein